MEARRTKRRCMEMGCDLFKAWMAYLQGARPQSDKANVR
jgi:hypothetical protein